MKPNLQMKEAYEKLKEFQSSFLLTHHNQPTEMSEEESELRVKLIAAELIEALKATHKGGRFREGYQNLLDYMNEQFESEVETQTEEDVALVHQVDAYIDVLYLTMGAFAILGFEPTESFNIVHEANMGKLGEDGKIIRDEHGKIRKPDNWQELYAPEPKIQEEIERQLK